MIRRPPRSTLDRSSAASDVYKRQIGSVPRLEVVVQRRCPLRYMGVGDGDAELIVRPRIRETDEFKSPVGVDIDQVAVRWRVRRTCEHADAAVVVATNAENLLFED